MKNSQNIPEEAEKKRDSGATVDNGASVLEEPLQYLQHCADITGLDFVVWHADENGIICFVDIHVSFTIPFRVAAKAVFDVVIDDEIQFLRREPVVFCQCRVNFIEDGL